MFTLLVTNIPPDTNEEEITEHFRNLMGAEHKVFAVSIRAYLCVIYVLYTTI
jgi:RNA recognition motif-containing protein